MRKYAFAILLISILCAIQHTMAQTVVHRYDTICEGETGYHTYMDTLLYEDFEQELETCWKSRYNHYYDQGIDARRSLCLRSSTEYITVPADCFTAYEGEYAAFESDMRFNSGTSLIITPKIEVFDPDNTYVSFYFIMPGTQYTSGGMITQTADEGICTLSDAQDGNVYSNYLWHINYNSVTSYRTWTYHQSSLQNYTAGSYHVNFAHFNEGGFGFGLDNLLVYGPRKVDIPASVTAAAAGSIITSTQTYTGGTGCTKTVITHWYVKPRTEHHDTASTCTSYTWNGAPYSSTGEYSKTGLTNAEGCDSTAYLHLTVNSAIRTVTIKDTCDTYTWPSNSQTYTSSQLDSVTIPSSQGCDSTSVLNLTIRHSSTDTISHTDCDNYLWPLDGQNYTSSTTATHIIVNQAGCDSTVVLNLTINASSHAPTISISQCTPYTWEFNGRTYNSSGTYADTIANQAGCDSIATLNLTITQSATGPSLNTENCTPFTWSATRRTYDTTGIYHDTLVAANGCDSVLTLNFTRHYALHVDTHVTRCDSFYWAGKMRNYYASTVDSMRQANRYGCDSTTVLHLTINTSTIGDTVEPESDTVCDRYQWAVTTTTYTTSGIYSARMRNSKGCDSTLWLRLNLRQSTEAINTLISCDSFRWNITGLTYHASGTYSDTTINTAGCDSIQILQLTLNQHSPTTIVNAINCGSYTWFANNQTYTASGTYQHTLRNRHGCDSLIELHLDLVPCPPQPLPDNVDDPFCTTDPPSNAFAMRQIYQCRNVNSMSTPMVGDVDGDGIPEIVACRYLAHSCYESVGNGMLVFDGQTGTLKYTIEVPSYAVSGQCMSLCDADRNGRAEFYMIAEDNYLYCFDATGRGQLWRSNEALNARYIVMSADVNADGRPEIVCGPYIFDAQTGTLLLQGTQESTGRGYCRYHGSCWNREWYMQALIDIDYDGQLEICAGNTIYKPIITNTTGSAGNTWSVVRQANAHSNIQRWDGQTFVADFDNDGDIDVCVIGFSTNGRDCGNGRVDLYVWEGQTSDILAYYIASVDLPSIPFAGDLDGNGTPEIIFNCGSGMHAFTYDPSLPNKIRLMHQERRFAETAGFTVFDFNQDGREEIVYRNINQMFIVDGATLTDLCSPIPISSGTVVEYPTVADVNGDGHAEIVVCHNQSVSAFGSQQQGAWGSARKVWNQWAYSSVNINEDLTVPQYQFNPATRFPNGKEPFNGFLRQMPRLNRNGDIYLNAPDVDIHATISYTDAGGALDINYCNVGENTLYAPFGLTIYKDRYHGEIYNTIEIENTLLPDSCGHIQIFIPRFFFCHTNIDSLVVSINDRGSGAAQRGGQQSECDSTNNIVSIPVQHLNCDVLLPDNIDDPHCTTTPPSNAFEMREMFVCPNANTYSTPMVGDLDGDGIPEIIYCHRMDFGGYSDGAAGNVLVVCDGRTGAHRWDLNVPTYTISGQLMSFADVDADGTAELFLLAEDRYLHCINAITGIERWRSLQQIDLRYMVMPADMNSDGRPEIVCGPYIFDARTGTLLLQGNMLTTGRGYGAPHTSSGHGRVYYLYALADIDQDGYIEICAGNTIYKPMIINSSGTSGNTWSVLRQAYDNTNIRGWDGQTFVADFDNDGDEDVCVIGFRTGGQTDVYVWDGQTPEVMGYQYVTMSGAYNTSMTPSIPFAGDLDGNGTPDIIFNHPDAMRAFTWDTSQPGDIRLMHYSTRFGETAGFTVFDFNQDGHEEIVYRNTREMYIVDGTTLADLCAPMVTYSSTVCEYAIVADCDGDGHAEILVCRSRTGGGPNGELAVYGSRQRGTWGSARKVWNQWSYNSVNINEDLTVPYHIFDVSTRFPNGKEPFNGYLRQMPRLDRNGDIYLTAPDVAIDSLTTNINYARNGATITVNYRNQGENTLYGPHGITIYEDNYRGTKLTEETTAESMNMGDCVTKDIFIPMNILCHLECDSLAISINDIGTGAAQHGEQQSECDTVNNVLVIPLQPFVPLADTLRITACDNYTWEAIGHDYQKGGVFNDTVSDQYGCDSVRWLELIVNYSDSSSFTDTICDDTTYAYAGLRLHESGAYDTVIRTVLDCDSTIRLHLTVLPTYQWTTTDTIDSYDLPYIASNGEPYTFDQKNELIRYRTVVFGCDSIEHLYLKVNYHVLHCDPKLQFPNLITPNGDGVNDLFCIIGLDNDCWPHNNLSIFNRWGDRVYYAENVKGTDCWDPDNLPTGTYYFHFRAHSPRGQLERSGVIEIIQE